MGPGKKMSSPPELQQMVQSSSDWNADLLQLFESGELYDCTFKVGRDDLESGCKVSNNYYNYCSGMSGLFCRSSNATRLSSPQRALISRNCLRASISKGLKWVEMSPLFWKILSQKCSRVS
jgi:hypothetical protein